MDARVLRVSPTWARETLRVAGFQITEAVWLPDGALVVHFCSTLPVSNWVLAALPQYLRIADEPVDAQFVDQMSFITGRETAVVFYKTAVRHSAPLLLKEREPSEESDVIVLEVA